MGTFIQRVIALTPDVIESVSKLLPAGFPTVVSEKIFVGLLNQVKQLQSGDH